jgi:hypothetical protein
MSVKPSSTSVLLIGAGGAFGKPLVEEFISQKAKFAKIGILSDPAKVQKFQEARENGVEIVSGSYLDPNSYHGINPVKENIKYSADKSPQAMTL